MASVYSRGRFFPMAGIGGFRGSPGFRALPIMRRAYFRGGFAISGVTRDSGGSPLAGCQVHLHEAGTDTKIAESVSDGAGAYTLRTPHNAGFFYVVAFNPADGTVAGTTVRTLVALEVP